MVSLHIIDRKNGSKQDINSLNVQLNGPKIRATRSNLIDNYKKQITIRFDLNSYTLTKSKI